MALDRSHALVRKFKKLEIIGFKGLKLKMREIISKQIAKVPLSSLAD